MTDLLSPAKTILSIQSHVAYGYVGNRAAVITLQSLGHEPIAVHTVQLSNHTGYGDFKGDFFTKDHIASVLDGIQSRGLFPQIDAILTGYLGDPDLGDLVLETVAQIRNSKDSKDNKDNTSPGTPYICDPVMGDVGRGFFVKDALPPFFKDKALKTADIITPNQFELSYLSDIDIKTRQDAIKACQNVHDYGVNLILLTSLEVEDTDPETIQMMLSTKDGARHIITTPKLHFDVPLNGSGDTTAALFAGYLLNGYSPKEALSKTACSIYAVFEETQRLHRRELALIQTQKSFMTPDERFPLIDLA